MEEATSKNESASAPADVDAYHALVARAFSKSAPHYDDDMNANPVARWTRRRSLAALDKAFSPGDRLLEIGCGTGTEALHMAARGVQVVATDAAPDMIRIVEQKAAALPYLQGWIATRVLPAGALGELLSEFGQGYFDGAYSSLGPLNCEPSLKPAIRALAQLVRPGGPVLLSLLNPHCLWETAWYLRAGKPNLAFRRWHGTTRATVRGEWPDEQVDVFYWRITAIEKAFYPYFRIVSRQALPWLLPPQYLGGLITLYPRLFRFLERIEDKTASAWPFCGLGDHYLLELIRTDEHIKSGSARRAWTSTVPEVRVAV